MQVQAVLDGKEAVGVLMAYGISGSGKTHTIEVRAGPSLSPVCSTLLPNTS